MLWIISKRRDQRAAPQSPKPIAPLSPIGRREEAAGHSQGTWVPNHEDSGRAIFRRRPWQGSACGTQPSPLSKDWQLMFVSLIYESEHPLGLRPRLQRFHRSRSAPHRFRPCWKKGGTDQSSLTVPFARSRSVRSMSRFLMLSRFSYCFFPRASANFNFTKDPRV